MGFLFGDGGAGKAAAAQAQAAEKSAAVQADANKVATAEAARQFDISTGIQKEQYAQGRSDIQPWLTTGTDALSKLAALYGLKGFDGAGNEIGSDTPGTGVEDFYKSPDYDFRFNEAMKGINANAAARKTLDSGATIKAAAKYAGNLASGEFNNYVSRLSALAGVGQNTATGAAASGQQYANTASQTGQGYADTVGRLALGNADRMSSIYTTQGNNTANAILAANAAQRNGFMSLAQLGLGAYALGAFGGGAAAGGGSTLSGGNFARSFA